MSPRVPASIRPENRKAEGRRRQTQPRVLVACLFSPSASSPEPPRTPPPRQCRLREFRSPARPRPGRPYRVSCRIGCARRVLSHAASSQHPDKLRNPLTAFPPPGTRRTIRGTGGRQIGGQGAVGVQPSLQIRPPRNAAKNRVQGKCSAFRALTGGGASGGAALRASQRPPGAAEEGRVGVRYTG